MMLHGHANALYSRVEIEGGRRIVAYVRHDNDEGRADALVEDGGSGKSIAAGLPEPLQRAPLHEQLAASALMPYCHEVGEHFAIEGISLNQHKPGGTRNCTLMLRECVLPWLEAVAKSRGE